MLNADGSKHNGKGGRVSGLFHSLGTIVNGESFGVAESYVTAVTCMEIIGIPTICAFSSHNLKDVALAWSRKYPDSCLIVFADNDRHLPTNRGMECAMAAVAVVGARASVIAPDFGNRQPAKDESDWNDLVRVVGRDVAEGQLSIISSRSEKLFLS